MTRYAQKRVATPRAGGAQPHRIDGSWSWSWRKA